MGFELPLFFYATLVFLPIFTLLCVFLQYLPFKRSFSMFYDSTVPIARRMLLRYTLIGAVVSGILLALSSPYVPAGAGERTVPVFDLVLLVDTSLSMNGRAMPNEPNRLDRTKTIARGIVDSFPYANIAVCEFTSNVFCRAPIGSSRDALLNTIDDLAIDSIIGSGSEITRALNSMPRELGLDEDKERVVVLLSDGGDKFNSMYLWDELDGVLANLYEHKIHVVSIGVGEMQPIPVAISEQYGIIFSSLDEEKMRRIAILTDGLYIHENDLGEDGLSFLRPYLIYAGVIGPKVANVSWIPGSLALVALGFYLFFFWKDP